MTDEYAVPLLPSRDLDRTMAFYERLGFAVRRDAHEPYLIARRGGWELHFFHFPDLDPTTSSFMCFLWTADAGLFAAWQTLGLPTAGIPRLQFVRNDVMRGFSEFAVIDPDGTLLRIGRRL